MFFFFPRVLLIPLVTSRLLIPLWTTKNPTKVQAYRELRGGDSEGTLLHV